MEEKEFNPIIEAVVSLRHYAMAVSENWNSMKSIGALINNDMEEATQLIEKYGSNTTRQRWSGELIDYNATKDHLQEIMNFVISKIKAKTTDGISERWNEYPGHVHTMEAYYDSMKNLGRSALPENKKQVWDELWHGILGAHEKIGNEAKAIGIQLGLMEECTPEEINELTDTILKHIPIKYSVKEAHKYTGEYMTAYEELKKEAAQKKNLWDRFLDILAGDTQQTPPQRVMMKRWVDGEKGDAH